MIGFLVAYVLSGIVGANAQSEYIFKDRYKLYALKDNVGVQGNFFLGSGRIDSDLKYYYLTDFEDGKKIDSLDVDEVILKQDDNPHIEVYEAQYKNEFIRFNFINFSSDKYKIYIPEGSIKYDFNVDLQ